MNYQELSKEVSYALRHAPWEYGLELDENGSVGIEDFINALRLDLRWKSITEIDLKKMIEVSDKKRHEINNGRIRALYGHTLPRKILNIQSIPPSILYHGTSQHSAKQIILEGLKPMSRQYVHLSTDCETAVRVGKRRDLNPVVLYVYAEKASDAGVRFFKVDNFVWLADYVPPNYITAEL